MSRDIEEILHKMRGKLGIVSSFIDHVEPVDSDTEEFKKAAQNSVESLTELVDELGGGLDD